jgi:phosphopentomutase
MNEKDRETGDGCRETGKQYQIDRVIARPFSGEPGAFIRIRARKDFSIAPPYPTLLDIAREAGIAVLGVGKVDDLFGHRGFSECEHTKSNADGLARIKRLLLENRPKDNKMIIFANLIDFDQEFGHRRDAAGFGKALEETDAALPELLELLSPADFFSIAADHGCDPTFGRGTDHTREYAPLLAVCGEAGAPRSLGIRESFADLGATAAEFLGLPRTTDGTSFFAEMRRKI